MNHFVMHTFHQHIMSLKSADRYIMTGGSITTGHSLTQPILVDIVLSILFVACTEFSTSTSVRQNIMLFVSYTFILLGLLGLAACAENCETCKYSTNACGEKYGGYVDCAIRPTTIDQTLAVMTLARQSSTLPFQCQSARRQLSPRPRL